MLATFCQNVADVNDSQHNDVFPQPRRSVQVRQREKFKGVDTPRELQEDGEGETRTKTL